ncbi:isochorismatase family protein [Oceanibaculum indicum]|uniref:Nicotinamidase-related amidase n=1 Tax=Oceanibaculum indicum TaxID=526216 RepID=A0A420WQJ3_9PROT|nr:isochorismatase family protein [Oceanibaculum indicum]RKQ73317.1 nicotinamidase-related amidase [Oceanibaculum indicum]
MLLHHADCSMLLVDAQERLLPALDGQQGMVAACGLLLRAARELEVPVLATVQYPKGLGGVVPALAALLPPDAVAEKICFDAMAEPGMAGRVAALKRRRVVLCGAEAHVCVLQTAFGLQAAGYEVVVAADAVASRDPEDRQRGLARMERAGMLVATSEMVVFEWLRLADTPAFKAMIPFIKRLKEKS